MARGAQVKPYTMSHAWFRKYHQSAFALDTWTYSFEAGEQEHRKSRAVELQRQGAVLPLAVFRQFVATVLARFENASAAEDAAAAYSHGSR